MSKYKLIRNPFTKKFQRVLSDSYIATIAAGLNFKEGVADSASLPSSGNVTHDARITNDNHHLYIWDGTAWQDQGDIFNIAWAAIDDKPNSSVVDIDDAVAKKHIQNTDSKLNDGVNEVTASELKSLLAYKDTIDQNIFLNSYYIAKAGALSKFNMVNGVVDEFEDEDGVDLPNSSGYEYDGVNKLYKNLTGFEYLWGSAVSGFFANVDNLGNKIVRNSTDYTYIYLSSDYGTTWTDISPTVSGTPHWNWGIFSKDGSKLIVAGTRLFISSDFGVNWTEVQPKGDVDSNWKSAAISSDGNYLIASEVGGRIYRSVDGGVNWIETKPFGDIDTSAKLKMNSVGDKIIIINLTHLFISSDYGATWTEKITGQSYNFTDIDIDFSGQTLIVSGRQVWGSLDFGVSWFSINSYGSTHYKTVAVSGNGMYMAYNNQNDRLLVSSDQGNTWTETRPDGDVNRNYTQLSLNFSGYILTAAMAAGSYYFKVGKIPGIQNIVLQSKSSSATLTPDSFKGLIVYKPVDPIILNTDLNFYLSRDNGVTWTKTTLAELNTIDNAKKIISVDADVSSQPNGTQIKYKLTTANEKLLEVHSVEYWWD